MTLKELYQVAPQAFTFIVTRDDEFNKTSSREYTGGAEDGDKEVVRVYPTSYPMLKNVLEVELAGDGDPAPSVRTVEDLLELEIDIDVYDDVCEDIAICFCGPQELTEEGKEYFAPVLCLPVEVNDESGYAIVHVDDPDEKVWKRRLKAAKEFFYAAAGYCDADLYDKWFEEG